MYCKNCGNEIDDKVSICIHCGVAVKEKTTTTKKEPALSVILSFFLPGLGQLYNGEARKALLFFIISIVLTIITICTIGIGYIFYFPFWIYNMVEAYSTAKKINLDE